MVSKTFSPKGFLKSLPQDRRTTPALVVDLSVLERDFQAFLTGFPGVPIFYAVKANPHPEVLTRLASLGAGFEISSQGELRLVKQIGVPGARIISGNPVKAPGFIAEAHDAGVTHFAFDSAAEVDKIARLAPGARLSIRLTVPNTGSDWPLDKKYGVEKEQALSLLEYAREKGLHPSGVAFHVGSQCRTLGSWTHAMGEAKDLWEGAVARGIRLEVVNVGGGMPVAHDDRDVPSISSIGEEVLRARDSLFPSDVRLWAEPGRAVIGRAGTMLCSVVGVAWKNETRWVYLDAGVFHGLTEALGGISYRFLADVEGPLDPCTLAGPSCDSMDVIAENAMLPPVECGDVVVIPATGAYTAAYASNFNGFPGPETVIIDGGVDA